MSTLLKQQESEHGSAKAQRSNVLRRLIDAGGAWVPAAKIAELALQYNARIFELRKLGFKIESRIVEENGTRFSYYRLLPSTASAVSMGRCNTQVEPDLH